MKKIYLSVLAIALTIGVVSGTAYALFSDQVQIQGVTLKAGSADLQISRTGTSFGDSMSFAGAFENDLLYPGWGMDGNKCDTFWLKNNSSAPISLKLSAKLPDGGVTEEVANSWNVMKDKVEIGLDDALNPMTAMVWRTLAQWNSSSAEFDGVIPNFTIPLVNPKMAKICVRLPTTVGNEIAGKWLSNVKFDITGTQTN